MWQQIASQIGQEDVESHGYMDKDTVIAEDTAKDMDEAAEMADTAAESEGPTKTPVLHAGTASGLATRKKSAAQKGGPKKPKCNGWKDETWKQDLLGRRASWQDQHQYTTQTRETSILTQVQLTTSALTNCSSQTWECFQVQSQSTWEMESQSKQLQPAWFSYVQVFYIYYS